MTRQNDNRRLYEIIKGHSVKYEGHVPKSLRKWCDKNAEKVKEVCYGGGFCTDSGNAYDILLRNHWSTDEAMHTIIEPTVDAALRQLRTVEPCDCPECERENPEEVGR